MSLFLPTCVAEWPISPRGKLALSGCSHLFKTNNENNRCNDPCCTAWHAACCLHAKNVYVWLYTCRWYVCYISKLSAGIRSSFSSMHNGHAWCASRHIIESTYTSPSRLRTVVSLATPSWLLDCPPCSNFQHVTLAGNQLQPSCAARRRCIAAG